MRQRSAFDSGPAGAYRPDIDGLRGLAVLAVVLYHAFPAVVCNGFVGVDVFFVVSGFLITGIVLDDLERGRFRFSHFYARRIRRLFPALIVVLAAAFAFALVVFIDKELRQFTKHVAAASAFVSNFVLWHESGYFDTASRAKPLLHLWSLGIEEQFYLAWPLVLWLAWRRARWLAGLVLVLAGGSLLLELHEVYRDPAEAFYSPLTRFWELMAGGFLAVWRRLEADPGGWHRAVSLAARVLRPGGRIAGAAACAAIVALALSTVAVRNAASFPGVWAIVPVAATACLIATGPDTWIHHLLRWRALVAVGLISYPLYLWHWPLLSFASIMGYDTPRMNGALVAASFLLAWLTWRCVEMPVRFGRGFDRTKIAALTAGIALFGVAGMLGSQGLVSSPAQERLREYSADLDWTYDTSPRLQPYPFTSGDFPGAGKLLDDLKRNSKVMGFRWIPSGSARKTLYIGDSHMEQYWPRVDQLIRDFPGRTRSAVFLTASRFLPIPGVLADQADSQFVGLAQAMLDFALSDPSIDTVVISALWGAYFADAKSFRPEDKSIFYVMVDGRPQHLRRGRRANDIALRSLGEMIATLRQAGKRVFLVQTVPGGPIQLRRKWTGPELFAPPVLVSDFLAENGPLRERLFRVAEESGAEVLDPYAALCSGGECPVLYERGHPVYMDGTHFADRFARRHLTYIDRTLLLE